MIAVTIYFKWINYLKEIYFLSIIILNKIYTYFLIFQLILHVKNQFLY
jgi:hypothetical protein